MPIKDRSSAMHVLWLRHISDCSDLVIIRFDSTRGPCKRKERCFFNFELELIWVEPDIVFSCCIQDVKYVLIMFGLTLVIDEGIISDPTQAIQLVSKGGIHLLLEYVSNSGEAKRKSSPSVFVPWGVQSAWSTALIVEFNLPEPVA